MDSRICKSRLASSSLVIGALLALVAIARLGASSTDTAMLKRIASRVDDRAGIILH
jgi:hypothetical protein